MTIKESAKYIVDEIKKGREDLDSRMRCRGHEWRELVNANFHKFYCIHCLTFAQKEPGLEVIKITFNKVEEEK